MVDTYLGFNILRVFLTIKYGRVVVGSRQLFRENS